MAEQRDPIRGAHRQWVRHGWEGSADGMALVTSVMRVQQLLMERIESVLKPHDLTFARFEILRLLSFSSTGAMPMARVGSLLQVHATSVTSAVDRLERQGFVTRSRHPSDGRVVLASLTTAGGEVVEAATADLNAGVFDDVGLDAPDVADLTTLLGRLRTAAGDHVEP
ncbi:MarR family winged helix-turn-helix transcriptional regulator [Solicola sp. PLA-1-18]|uniref:MarR family winged helix-turn-helix transcriptional regulator n=1 Tax=Solicola sp. PLA-1-18 TaxID=3380532 RepID=UPI003B811246